MEGKLCWCIPVENEEEERSSFEQESFFNNLESLLLHGNEDFREQKDWSEKSQGGGKVKSKRIWHEKEIRFQ